MTAQRLRDLALAVLIGASVVDALPNWILPGLDRVDAVVSRPLRAMGIWQGNYRLFAPDPDRVNSWLEVVVMFDDGRNATWTTWDWRERGFYERIARGHAVKWAELVQRDNQKVLHRALSRWAMRHLRPPGDGPRPRPVGVQIVRHRWPIPRPGPRKAAMWRAYGTLPPPRDTYRGMKVIHEQEAR